MGTWLPNLEHGFIGNLCRAVANMPAHLATVSHSSMREQFLLQDPSDTLMDRIDRKLTAPQAGYGDPAVRGQQAIQYWGTLRKNLIRSHPALIEANSQA